MQITTEEISLEELNNNIVEYVLNSPHNTNPAILRQMLNSRGVSAPTKSTIIFEISSDDDLGDEITKQNDYLANVITGEVVTPEELAKMTLSGTGFIARETYGNNGLEINGKRYGLGQILGFGFTYSGNFLTITAISPEGDNKLASVNITDSDYTQRYVDALTQEIFNA